MRLKDEMSLASQLKSLGVKCEAFDGDTTTEQRRERFRVAILSMGEDDKRVTMDQEFARVYGCELDAIPNAQGS